MKISVDALTPTSRRVQVSFPATEITREFSEAYRSVSKVPLKGFRPGKAPRSVLTRYYGAKIADDIAEKLVERSIGNALRECDYSPASAVTFDRTTPVEGQDFTYSVSFYVVPVPRPLALHDLATVEGDFKPSPEQISAEISRWRDAASELVPIEDRGAESGDTVTANRTGTINGVPSDILTTKNVRLKLGSESLHPAVTDALIGAQPGDVREAIFTPERPITTAIETQEDADQTTPTEVLSIRLEVLAVAHEEVPELDDEFAKDLGFESLDHLTQHIAKVLEARNLRAAQEGVRRHNLERLIEINPFPLPEELVDQQAHANFHAAHPELGDTHDHTPQDLEAHRASICMQLRQDTLLKELASQLGLSVSESEVEQAFNEFAHQLRISPDMALKLLGGVERAYEMTYMRLLKDKALDSLATGARPANPELDNENEGTPTTLSIDNEAIAEVLK